MGGAWVLVLILFCFVMWVITSNYQERKQEQQKARKHAEYGDVGLWEHINRKPVRNDSRTFYASPEWRRLRYKALKIYGGKCACCGRSAKDGLKMHVDHIKPRSKYPELALKITNLQILCEECNIAKSNTDDIQWRR